jgi:mitogen-activated protein kinase kinase kinase
MLGTFKWVKGELIGKGTYGSVYLGLNATTGEMLAVKQVDVPSNLSDRDDDRSKSMVDALNAEIETLKDLDHPHIVQYLGYERTDRSFSIFLEYVPGGSVGRCLKKHGQFEENVIRSLIRQTLDGLAYLHAQGRLHRVLSHVATLTGRT